MPAEKEPEPERVNETVPVGVVGLVDVSVTEAAHVDAEPTLTLSGVQITPVVVVRRLAPTVAVPLLVL